MDCRPPDWASDLQYKSRRIFWSALFVFLTSISFLGYIDRAPSGIFSTVSKERYIRTTSGDPTEGNGSFEIGIIDGNIGGGNGLEVLPMVDQFFKFSNIRGIVLTSLILTFLIFFVYILSRSLWGWLLSSSARWASSTTLALVVPLIFFLSGLEFTPGMIEYQGKGSIKAIRIIGIFLYSLLISMILHLYSKELAPLGRSSAFYKRYKQFQARVGSGILNTTLAISIGGALTFASTSTNSPIPVILLVGTLFFPGIGATAYYYWRAVVAERRLQDMSNLSYVPDMSR